MAIKIKLDLTKLLKRSSESCWQASSFHQVLEKLHKRIPAELMAASNRAFKKQASPDGTAWPPRSDAYVKWLKKHDPGKNRTLIRSGHLRSSRQTFRRDNVSGIGSNLVYAAIHQMGGKTGRGRKTLMPVRSYLGLDQYSKDKIISIAKKLLQKYFSPHMRG